MEILTWSSIKTWRACRRRYYYAYVMMIISKGMNYAFYTGTLIHYMVNMSHIIRDLDDTLTRVRTFSDQLLLDYVSNYHVTGDDEDEMRKTNSLIDPICEGYFKRYNKNMPEPKHIEVIMEYQLSPDFVIKSKIDEIVKMPKNKSRLSLYEIKSTSSIDSNYVNRYSIDGQTMTYVIVADTYENISDIVLDCIKKPGIRQGKDEPSIMYFNRLMNLYTTETEKYFYRAPYPLNTRLIKEHLKSLKQTSVEIARALDNPKIESFPINSNSCYDFNKPCSYLPLCLNGVNDLNINMFMKKSSQHMELEKEGV